MNIGKNPDFELDNGLEFLRTPVKEFVKYEYKKLQTFVAAMGLPSNLKRKQLLAIIVAKKMGKDNMIPAILKEVTRQRNLNKRKAREAANRQNRLTYINRLFPPKFAPIPSQIISDTTKPVVPIPQYGHLLLQNTAQSTMQLDYQPCFGFNNMSLNYESNSNITQGRWSQPEDFQKRRETYTSVNYLESTPDISYYMPQPETYTYYYDTNITKKYCTPTTNTSPTATRGILHMSPATSTTPWYHQMLSTAVEFKSQYAPVNMTADMPLQPAGQFAESGITQNDVELTLKDYSIDEILDFILEEDKSNSDAKSTHSDEVNSEPDIESPICSTDTDGDLSNSIQEMYLLFYALMANRALWPLKRYAFTHGEIISFIFDCLSPLSSDTTTCFSPFIGSIPHPLEVYSSYEPKACVYPPNAHAPQNAKQSSSQNAPDYYLLQPESSLSYRVPQMYYRSRNYPNGYGTSQILNNHLSPANKSDMSRFAYAPPLAEYRIHLPNDKISDIDPQPSSFKRYVDLKPKPKKVEETFNVEATIPLQSVEEARVAFDSLEGINSVSIDIQDPTKTIHQIEHECQCLTSKIPCPFVTSYCNWYECAPLMAKHYREMHPEKIVPKKQAEFNIDFVKLGKLKNKGLKILQEYKNRICCVSLCNCDGFIYITVQDICESVEQHNDKIKAKLSFILGNIRRSWLGQVNSMIYPLSRLWTPEFSVMVPTESLQGLEGKLFKIRIDLDI